MTTPLTPFERCLYHRPIPRSPAGDLSNVDWIAEMNRLADRDALRIQAEAQNAWIKEVRARIFKNVHDYPKSKK